MTMLFTGKTEDCQEIRRILLAKAKGEELTLEEISKATMHLASCGECWKYNEDLKNLN